VSNTKTLTKTPWTREFKLRALARMDEASDVTALAASLGCRRELLYRWRRKYRSGGAQALHPIGRPLNAAKALDEALAPSLAGVGGGEQQRLAALERKIGQQQLDLDFFRAALRRVREQRLKTGVPGETASTR
jgi:transposase-like protein